MSETPPVDHRCGVLRLCVGGATQPSYQSEIDAALRSILLGDSDEVFLEKLAAIDRAKKKVNLQIVRCS